MSDAAAQILNGKQEDERTSPEMHNNVGSRAAGARELQVSVCITICTTSCCSDTPTKNPCHLAIKSKLRGKSSERTRAPLLGDGRGQMSYNESFESFRPK